VKVSVSRHRQFAPDRNTANQTPKKGLRQTFGRCPRKLLDDTVKAFQSALQLTEDRYSGGASPLSDVMQARTQIHAAQVQATEIDLQRANYEHAIAVLVGKAPAEFTLAPDSISWSRLWSWLHKWFCERARLQSCRKRRIKYGALVPA
jgi:hypothetical protein